MYLTNLQKTTGPSAKRDEEIFGVFFWIFIAALGVGGIFVLFCCCCNFCREKCARRVVVEQPAAQCAPAQRRCVSPLTLPSIQPIQPPPMEQDPRVVRFLNRLSEVHVRPHFTAAERRHARIYPEGTLFMTYDLHEPTGPPPVQRSFIQPILEDAALPPTRSRTARIAAARSYFMEIDTHPDRHQPT